jgi:methylmalonyl-CoA mutase C-terminal domain/subunit
LSLGRRLGAAGGLRFLLVLPGLSGGIIACSGHDRDADGDRDADRHRPADASSAPLLQGFGIGIQSARAWEALLVLLMAASLAHPAMSPGRLRILVAKPGLDGHDRGIKIVARALRDAGMEVIYTGLHQTPEQIASAALQEDVDAVGMSCLSGAHMTLFPKVVKLLEQQGAADIVVFGGGIIPRSDAVKLKEAGIAEVFTPGATTSSIIEWVRANVGSTDEAGTQSFPESPEA